jgi:hypothetical protein
MLTKVALTSSLLNCDKRRQLLRRKRIGRESRIERGRETKGKGKQSRRKERETKEKGLTAVPEALPSSAITHNASPSYDLLSDIVHCLYATAPQQSPLHLRSSAQCTPMSRGPERCLEQGGAEGHNYPETLVQQCGKKYQYVLYPQNLRLKLRVALNRQCMRSGAGVVVCGDDGTKMKTWQRKNSRIAGKKEDILTWTHCFRAVSDRTWLCTARWCHRESEVKKSLLDNTWSAVMWS